jgi:activator of 2-hydroxyglutaryl-CoA dehydratase
MTQIPKESKNPEKEIFIGLDLGSVSLNTVVLDNHNNIIEDY